MHRPDSKTPRKTVLITVFASVCFAADTTNGQDAKFEADIIIYGGTSSGVIAAVQAKKMGKSVILVGPEQTSGRSLERWFGLYRYWKQSGDRRTGPRFLSSHLAKVPTAFRMAVAKTI